MILGFLRMSKSEQRQAQQRTGGMMREEGIKIKEASIEHIGGVDISVSQLSVEGHR